MSSGFHFTLDESLYLLPERVVDLERYEASCGNLEPDPCRWIERIRIVLRKSETSSNRRIGMNSCGNHINYERLNEIVQVVDGESCCISKATIAQKNKLIF